MGWNRRGGSGVDDCVELFFLAQRNPLVARKRNHAAVGADRNAWNRSFRDRLGAEVGATDNRKARRRPSTCSGFFETSMNQERRCAAALDEANDRLRQWMVHLVV